jgi:hypothetical protein
LCAAPATAQESWAIPGFDTVGGGVFLGYAFGGDRGFEWGFEGFATHYTHEVSTCSSNDRAGLGPLLRLSLLGISRLALTGALHGGTELARPALAFDGELGGTISYQNGAARPAIHTGLLAESFFWNAYARQEWLLPSYSVGGGMRVLATFGSPGMCVEGRPFRGDQGKSRRARVRTTAAFDARSPEAARWARRASEECASVPAFLQLALELAELGAPAALVVRALAAADEELGHAHAAAHVASGFGGAPVRLTPPALRFRPALPRKQALLRLARESWLDGCHNEALAAKIARAERCETRTHEEGAALQLIEREESEHAALALDVLRWTLDQAPELARLLKMPGATQSELHGPTLLRPEALRALVQDHRAATNGVLVALS